MGNRRQARQHAIQLLYQSEYAEVHPLETAHSFWPGALGREGHDLSMQLFRGTLERLEAIDRLIEKHSEHWKLQRISTIDRNILRVAAFELLCGASTPGRAVIDEAIEIAKVFGSEASPAFINGVLDKIYHESQRQPLEGASRL